MALDDYVSESNLLDEITPPSLEEYYSDAQSEPDLDMDLLDALPLSIVPFTTSGLKRARMIKNIQLESGVKVFKDGVSGGDQVKVNKYHYIFDLLN